MLDVIKINFPSFSGLTDKIGEKSRGSYWSTLLLVMVFALAFCPYSGVLYFVMLIPMTVASASGLYLPVLFAVSTGFPVILFAWLMLLVMSVNYTIKSRHLNCGFVVLFRLFLLESEYTM